MSCVDRSGRLMLEAGHAIHCPTTEDAASTNKNEVLNGTDWPELDMIHETGYLMYR